MKKVIAKCEEGKWTVVLKYDENEYFSPHEILQIMRTVKMEFRHYVRRLRAARKENANA